ncbi:hypothetical protein TREES_T100015949 [Tupaia chinensis]|uniref:Uncharacterized protein n=1 Tax=Tupaia chinensis TaxID=246437 RepID=L9KSF7_TUPCH|nr:hypothetical protein TREES_T100015949 [Tupaia chinensis]
MRRAGQYLLVAECATTQGQPGTRGFPGFPGPIGLDGKPGQCGEYPHRVSESLTLSRSLDPTPGALPRAQPHLPRVPSPDGVRRTGAHSPPLHSAAGEVVQGGEFTLNICESPSFSSDTPAHRILQVGNAKPIPPHSSSELPWSQSSGRRQKAPPQTGEGTSTALLGKGLPGPPGPKGDPGIQGYHGRKGAPGVAVAGLKGAPGVAVAGLKGEPGTTGAKVLLQRERSGLHGALVTRRSSGNNSMPPGTLKLRSFTGRPQVSTNQDFAWRTKLNMADATAPQAELSNLFIEATGFAKFDT